MPGHYHRYSEEEKQFVRNNIKGTRISKLTDMFNKEFELNLKKSQIKSLVERLGLKSGLDTKFKKGQEPWNKGMKGLNFGSSTQFKKGNVPSNKKPIGSERIDKKDGYTLIKVDEPNIWEMKHRHLYRKHKGKIPNDSVVIFADQDRTNFNLDNLILIKRKELLIANKDDLLHEDAESTKVGVNIAKIKSRVNELEKGER